MTPSSFPPWRTRCATTRRDPLTGSPTVPTDNRHRAAIAAPLTDLVQREIDRHGVLRVPKNSVRYTVQR